MLAKIIITMKLRSYQLEGSIKVIIQEDGIRKEMETQRRRYVSASSKVPHSPVRSEGSGLLLQPNVLLRLC
jgi:3-hydroxyanthranilate 3,4-dioxygenase